MDFLDDLIKHYLRESQQGFGAAIFGGFLLIAAILLLRLANPLSLLKGLSLPAILIGLIMTVGGIADGYVARKSISGKAGLYKTDQKTFFKTEVPQVEKTHQSWKKVKRMWSIFTLAGIILLFTIRKDYWTGVAIGTIILSMAGFTEETISKNFNEKYYRKVMDQSPKTDTLKSNKPANTMPVDVPLNMNEEKQDQDQKINHHTPNNLSLSLKDGPSLNLHFEIKKYNFLTLDTTLKNTTLSNNLY